MTKDKFKDNFSCAIHSLVGLTKKLCSNSFSTKYRFIVRPNTAAVDSHLDSEEIRFHKKIVAYGNKYITDTEVVDLLSSNGKVPLWINSSVLESSENWTTIELITSRRLRTEDELNKVADEFPPFHLQVPLPPDRVEGQKFDINWRTRRLKTNGLWNWLKRT